MKPPYDTVLFDLDGTLCETGEGIRNGVRYALNAVGAPVPDDGTLRRFIGPPLWDCFRDYCGMDAEQSGEAVQRYRKYYRETGWLEGRPYDGMRELLHDLKQSGYILTTATTKPEEMAVRILRHHGLFPYFETVCGALPDGARSDKAELIHCALGRCGREPNPQCVMVGDTHFDILGARACGIPSVGVLYGYGTRRELEEAGANTFAENAAALRRTLLP
jgi:phosphoglycolate phosphatase